MNEHEYEEETEIVFEPEESPIKNLWNNIVFYSTITWYIIKGLVFWIGSMGGVEIEVGYEEDGEKVNYLYLEKLW